METIPTPRCEAATREDETYEGKFVYVELEFARQLERELHVAKQALEEISFGVPFKTKPGGCTQIELTKIQLQTIADMALAKLNTISA